MFDKITLHDYAKPLAQRKRTFTGPYYWHPRNPAKSDGVGFYMSTKDKSYGVRFQVDRHGSAFDLRLTEANDHLDGSRLSRIDSYWFNDDCGDSISPIVAQLPKGRGWLAGWTMGHGMASSLCTSHVHGTAEEAARAAHDEAERAADEQREYEAEQDAIFAQEEALLHNSEVGA